MDRIIETALENEFENNFLQYSMSVITDRALPDVRDGCKPVHRRILYAMDKMNLSNNGKHKKSATISGHVIGNYHAHGEASVYEAMVKLAQPFYMRYPLIDWQGNVGNISGDSAAASRYTEAKLSRLGELMVDGLGKNTVDMKLNFSEELYEPTVLTSLFPNLLVNGTNGIAVGMASSMLPHNLTEVIDGLIACINNENITLPELMEIIKGPDFPLGGTIINGDVLESMYETGKTGKGKALRLRAPYTITENRRNGRSSIVFTSVPYGTTVGGILEEVEKLVDGGKLPELYEFANESNEENGVRLVFELQIGSDTDSVLHKLFSESGLESALGMNNTCIVDGSPMTLPLIDLMKLYLNHQADVLRKSLSFDIEAIKSRLSILLGYKAILEDLDRAILIITTSKNTSEAQAALKEAFNLDDRQSKAVLDLKLSRLTKMGIDELEEEIKKLQDRLNVLQNRLDNLRETLIHNLTVVKQEFGDARRTEISIIDRRLDKTKKAIATGTVQTFTVDENFRVSQKGKGSTSLSKKDFTVLSNGWVFAFSSAGRCHKIPASKVSPGTNLSTLVSLMPGEKLICIATSYQLSDEMVFATSANMVKKMSLETFDSGKTVSYIKLEDGESVIAGTANVHQYITLVSSDDYLLSFPVSEINATGRTSKGVKGMNLHKGCVLSEVSFSDTVDTVGKRGRVGSKIS